MPDVVIDDITTHFELIGSGPPLLMFSPGGFDATIGKWTSLGIYRDIKLMDHLLNEYTCIVFDRRESGRSGGRVERLTWASYAAQGKGLLDHLEIKQAHLMGGCMGCPPALQFGVTHPEVVLSMVLYWPVGGVRYRIRGQSRFAEHLAFVQQNDMNALVSFVNSHEKTFAQDARVGPWASVLRRDREFADAYTRIQPERYQIIVAGIARTLLDRDTALGPEPEDLLGLNIPTFIVPGQDVSHPTSAARYLEECLEGAEYWDVPVAEQTDKTAAARVLGFLQGAALQP